MDPSLQQAFDALSARRWAVAEGTATHRIEKLRRLMRTVADRRETLAAAVQRDLGRHPAETELAELQPLLLEVKHAIRHLRRWMARRRAPTPWVLTGTRAEIQYEPKGVVLILAPWNYPLNLTLAPLVAAVAAGNCVLVKPSEKAPETAAAMALLIDDVFDGDEVACVTGGPEIAEQLLTLPFDHFFFTGSGRKGRMVMHAAAEHLASSTLELGGKSPAIVHEDAALQRAAERIVWGKFVNAGQTCIAPDYVLVHERRVQAFVGHATDAIRRFYAGAQSEGLCPIVDIGAWERLTAMLDAATSAGARIAAGGEASRAGRHIAPTVLTGVPSDGALMKDEIFGPILPVLPYGSLDAAIAFVRARPAPLALYVFSGTRDVFERTVRQTTAGGSIWNNVFLHFANPNLPFGGGLGSYHGWFGFRAFSHERALMRQGRFSGMHLFYPPYGAHTRRRLGWVRRLIGW